MRSRRDRNAFRPNLDALPSRIAPTDFIPLPPMSMNLGSSVLPPPELSLAITPDPLNLTATTCTL